MLANALAHEKPERDCAGGLESNDGCKDLLMLVADQATELRKACSPPWKKYRRNA